MRNDGKRKNSRIFGFCLVTALLLAGCSQRQEEEGNMIVVENSGTAVSYDFCEAEIGDVVLTQRISCTFKQQNEQKVTFPMTGRLVDKVYVKEGDTVRKGDLLAELSVGDLKRRIEDLEYRIKRSELQLEYAQTNEDLDISEVWVNYVYNHAYDEKSRDQVLDSIRQNYRYQREDSEDALEVDRQNLRKLKQELSRCSMYAEIDGIVYKIENNLEGSTSAEDGPVMTIVDNSLCLFEMESPEYAGCFKEGQILTMTVSSGSPSGEIKLTPYEIESWGKVQQFSVVDGVTASSIKLGTKGYMQFVVDSREQVLRLPLSAVNSADGRHYVYVVDEDNMRQIRWVETGFEGNDAVEILSGLEEGEKVVRK